MRFPKKLALILAGVVATILVLLLVIPFLFRDRIAARLKSEVANSVNAKVQWGDVNLGLLRDFPDVSLGLDRLSIVGVAPFAGDTLLAMRQAHLVLDLGSVVGYLRSGDKIVVREIRLTEPSLALRVRSDGAANWNITRPSAARSTDTSRAIGVTLRNLSITSGRVTLDDEQSHLVASVAGLNESLRGDFGADRMVMSTRTHADSVSLRFAGIPYLTRVGIELNADVNADLRANKFTFANDSLRLNNLVLAFSGAVQVAKPNVVMAVKFASPSTSFRDILSLVPAVYAHDFAQLQASGTMSTSGSVFGTYGPKAFPQLALRARVDNGAFKYPSLPLPSRDISLDLSITNPGGSPDRTVVDLERFHASLGGRPLDARFVVRTPVSDPDVDLRLVGSVDLADVARTIKLTGVEGLAGAVRADLAVHTRLSDVNSARYDRVAASGTLNASRVALRAGTPARAIAIDTTALHFTPRTTELAAFSARVGNSDARATGSLDNLLGYLLHDDALRGTASVTSNVVDLNEWKSKEKTTAVIPVPARVDFALKAAAARVQYGGLALNNVRGNLRVKDQRVTLDELHMETLRGSVVANGYYETTVVDRPTFDMNMTLASVDIPSAFAALTTVQQLAPVARWAQGALSGTVGLKGPLGHDMTPVFTALSGKGDISTEQLMMQGAPVLEKLADALKLNQIRKPAIGAVRMAFDVADGRVKVKPFVANVAGVDMTVAGSNGIDQTLKYDLGLALPHNLLGGSAGATIAKLASQAGKALDSTSVVRVAALLTGTVANPAIALNLGDVANSAREAVKAEVATRTEAVKQKADSAITNARLRARAEADRIIAEAERQAATIRVNARTLAANAQKEGQLRADSLVARATNPMAKLAATAAANRLRSESNQQAERAVHEADARADALIAEAKKKADALMLPKP